MWGPYQEIDCGHMKVEMLKASCWILNTRNAKAGEYSYLWFRRNDQARDTSKVISISTILNVMRLDEMNKQVKEEKSGFSDWMEMNVKRQIENEGRSQ